MNAVVSIIIPIYNVQQYLSRCLESVINQSYKNIEIILVNDGSTDSSLEICEKFSQIDQRIKLYSKSNGGLSDARNFGIEKSTGNYITFVDSDDFISEDYVEYLYYLLKKFNTAMSLCSIYTHYTSSGKIVDNGNGEETKLSSKECIEKMCYHNLVDTCAYAKLYRRDLFEDISFPKGKLFEDIGTIYKFFDKSTEIACGFQAKYYYEIRPNSIVTSTFNEKKFDLLEMTDQMKRFVDKNYPTLNTATLRRSVYARFSTLNQMLDVKGYELQRQEMIQYIKLNKLSLLKNKKVPNRDKIGIVVLSYFGYSVYKRIWKMYFNLQRGG
ncbi:glycosyltransferase family 2 protein [Streptococcus orisratti]